ncbi:MAG TPA: hypothetical protein VJC12_00400 [Candidatus Paceibacterota bacterium]
MVFEGTPREGFDAGPDLRESFEAPVGKPRSELGDRLAMLSPDDQKVFRESIARAGISFDQFDEYTNSVDNPMIANQFIEQFVYPVLLSESETEKLKAGKRAKEALTALYGKKKPD